MTRTAPLIIRSALFATLVGTALLVVKTLDRHADISPVFRKEQVVVADAPEVVFIGSSRTYRHVVTPLFDSLRAASGDPTTSYNFGVPGSSGLEIHYRADWVLDHAPEALRQMVVELRPVELQLPASLRRSRRAQYHHDLRRARLAAATAMAADTTREVRLIAARERWRVWLENTFLVGWGPAALSSGVSVLEGADVRGANNQGYAPLDSASSEGAAERRAAFLAPEAQAAFSGIVRDIRDRETPSAADRVLADTWVDLVARAAARGVEVVFVEQVAETQASGVADALIEAGQPVIVLNDPVRHPEWYDRTAWFDRAHAAEPLARELTRALADRLPSPGRDS